MLTRGPNMVTRKDIFLLQWFFVGYQCVNEEWGHVGMFSVKQIVDSRSQAGCR